MIKIDGKTREEIEAVVDPFVRRVYMTHGAKPIAGPFAEQIAREIRLAVEFGAMLGKSPDDGGEVEFYRIASLYAIDRANLFCGEVTEMEI
jgi:hypothetical protein